MAKTFTSLKEVPTGTGPGQIQIGKCSAVLDNRMQCWRAGEFLVTTTKTVTTPAVMDGDKVVTPEDKAEVLDSQYQLCRAHKLFEEQQYENEKIKEANATAKTTETKPADQK